MILFARKMGVAGLGRGGLDLGYLFHKHDFGLWTIQTQIIEIQMATPSPGSWKQTALSILAGAGAGYLLGVLSARLLWDQRGRHGVCGPNSDRPS